MGGRRLFARKTVALLGAAGALTIHGWIGYMAMAVCVALAGWRAAARAPVVLVASAALIAVTSLVHVAFFGAGRYGLVVVPFVAMTGFVKAGRA
jgi:hypothetical protein